MRGGSRAQPEYDALRLPHREAPREAVAKALLESILPSLSDTVLVPLLMGEDGVKRRECKGEGQWRRVACAWGMRIWVQTEERGGGGRRVLWRRESCPEVREGVVWQSYVVMFFPHVGLVSLRHGPPGSVR